MLKKIGWSGLAILCGCAHPSISNPSAVQVSDRHPSDAEIQPELMAAALKFKGTPESSDPGIVTGMRGVVRLTDLSTSITFVVTAKSDTAREKRVSVPLFDSRFQCELEISTQLKACFVVCKDTYARGPDASMEIETDGDPAYFHPAALMLNGPSHSYLLTITHCSPRPKR